ncbi:hypothetical protein EMIT0232MI5_20219 [Pseudomonas sp. IT-232MI5]
MQLAPRADPVAALDAFIRQQRHQLRIRLGHVARQYGNAQSRPRRFLLRNDTGAVKHNPRAATETVEKHQFLAEQQIVDITDPRMPPKVLAAVQGRRLIEIALAGVERESIVGEFARNQHVRRRALQVNADFRFTVEDADEARHGDQFHFQSRIAFEQADHAAGEKLDAQPFRHPHTNLAQWRGGLGDLFLRQQRHVFHRFSMLKQRLPRWGHFVALRVLDEQRGAEAFLDGFDVAGDGGVGGVEAAGGGEQAAAALQLEKKPQVVPVEHGVSLSAKVYAGCLKTHSGCAKTNILLTKANN